MQSLWGPHGLLITFLTDFPYSPAFWGSSFLVGFFVGRYSKDGCAIWIGPAALLIFAALIVASVPGYEQSQYELAISNHSFLKYIWGGLFSVDSSMCGSEECLGKAMFTTPVLNCVAYSIGAWLAIRIPNSLRTP